MKLHTTSVMALLDASHSPFHAVKNMASLLRRADFVELDESRPYSLKKGGRYFVRRNGTSIIAFKIPANAICSFKVASTHTDSPTFKIKPRPVLMAKNLVKLNVEAYGGGLYSTWMDRPLSLAGRVVVENDGKLETVLVDVTRDLLEIPSLCIHMNRNANSNATYNPAVDMLPVIATVKDGEEFNFQDFLEKEAGIKGDILGHDLFLYVREKSHIVGANQDFIVSPRLDDLAAAYTVLLGFLSAHPTQSIDVFASFDNEEVGSLTRQGADSSFLEETLSRIANAIDGGADALARGVASGFALSVDNAHANHPNHPEMSDQTTNVKMNEGIVLKYNASQKYTTDGYSAAVVKAVAKIAGVAVQEYTNRSDLPGGSTLGNLSNRHVSFLSADIGIAQLAMHSSFEMAGVADIDAMVEFVKTYYSVPLVIGAESTKIG